jgi:hypothetical protein
MKKLLSDDYNTTHHSLLITQLKNIQLIAKLIDVSLKKFE